MNVWKVRAVAGAVVVPAAAAAPARAQNAQEGEAHFNIGLTHLREGRMTLALDELKKAVKADPKNPYFYKALGLCYMQLRKYNDAIDALHTSIKLNPYYVDARNDLGTALILAGKRDDGKAELLSAFNEPTNPSPDLSARNLGQAYLEEKNYTEAASWFRSSLTRNNKQVDANLGLAESLQGLSRADEALRTLEEAVKLMPNQPALLLALGQAYYGAGRFNEARARLEEARNKDANGATGRRAGELLQQFAK
jgi:Flp pilus assembly protein TadD